MSGLLDAHIEDLDENGVEIILTLEDEEDGDELIETLEAPARLLRKIINPEPC